jgi:hypothetical protein
MNTDYLLKAVAFLREIGLTVTEDPTAKSFMRKVAIDKGTLRYRPDAPVGDLLHEAGHLAIIPTRFRSYMDGNITIGIKRMFDELGQENTPPDSPIYHACLQSSDTEATAWAWAVGVHLGIPEELVIEDNQYGRTGATIRACLAARAYLGINGLTWAGYCASNAPYAKVSGKPLYPQLAFWLQA